MIYYWPVNLSPPQIKPYDQGLLTGSGHKALLNLLYPSFWRGLIRGKYVEQHIYVHAWGLAGMGVHASSV